MKRCLLWALFQIILQQLHMLENGFKTIGIIRGEEPKIK
jgi:hypothetical protein